MLLFLLARGVCALDPSLDISQYAHTAFRVRDGFGKGFFLSIAQTPDGYLWLGTDSGLLRFDGVRPTLWQPPARQQLPSIDIPTLLVTRDGALWIGTANGLARWKDGKLNTWSETSGQRISSLLQDRTGAVWIGSGSARTGRLCAFQSERIQCHDDHLGSAVRSLYEDSDGNLLLGVDNGVWKWTTGRSAFFPLTEERMNETIRQDSPLPILIGTQVGIFRFTGGRVERYRLPGFPPRFRASRILRDRDGGLWVATLDRGLLHYYQGKTDAFSEADGLSGDSVADIFEDREGNIWAATPNGLDRFRGYAAPRIDSKQGLSNTGIESILAAKDGGVWIATFNGLNRWKGGRISVLGHGGGTRERGGTLNELTHCLFQDSRGRIWVSTSEETGYLQDGRFVPVLHFRGSWVYSMAEAPAGHIWVANDPNGLFHLVDGKVVENIPWAVLGHKDYARVLLADPWQQGLWLGFAQGGVVYFAGGRVQKSYSAADGLGRGMVNGLRFEAGGVLWAATAGGLSRISDGRVTTMTSRNGVPCDTAHWSVEDDDHSLWLYMACGLVRITRPEVDAWFATPARSVQAQLFDASDGVRNPTYSSQLYSATKSSDGRIWFAGFDGVGVIDPRHLGFNDLRPPVHIEQMLGDGKKYDIARRLRLPPRVRNLAFDFVALSLVAPEKNRYRFKLEGWDPDWRDTVNELRVEYTNLPPRSYRFRVIASNNSGVWNETGDTVEFSIAPAYYQTTWFGVSCVTAFLAVIWALHRLRLYQIRREFNAQFDGRVDERMRVARDLHDTMLQSFQAGLIQMQAGYNLLSRRPEKAAEAIQKAITTSAGAIAEGREAIQNMRSSTVTKNDLAQAIRVAGDQMAAEGSVTFDVRVQGLSRDVHPILRDDVYRIGLEAMRNAFRHSGAHAIEAEIVYGDSLRVRIRDDGKGIDPAIMKEGRSGHYGLSGMRERAERIGGKLDVWTGPGAGTEIQLSIPGAIAFGTGGIGSLFGRFRRRNKSDAAAQS